MSKKIIVANWKMNPTSEKEAISLAKATDKNGVIISAPFVFIPVVKKVLKKAKLGAQDIAPSSVGSQTGEVSADMLKGFGVKYVIIGHSERRAMGESNNIVNKKLKMALKSGLTPIVCVGESHRDNQMKYLGFVSAQINESFKNLSSVDFKKIIIAYEPVWAIGKDAEREATPEESHEMAIFIKKVLSDTFGGNNAKNVKILYGGSINKKNSYSFLNYGGVDGLLVGRASLDQKEFNEIIKNA